MNDYYLKAKAFIEMLPYTKKPYNSRNWGHPWHSLCSYHGKLKPSIAYFLVNWFSNPGDKVFDPLCGVGTIPFEASLQGRIGIGNDLSKMAYVITKAKLNFPNIDDVLDDLYSLEKYIEKNKAKFDIENLPYSDFGFNGKIPDYFHRDTYCELLAAREYFKKIRDFSDSQAFILSALLHILHGNRPYALSRTSHSLTPYAPTGEFIYKNVIHHLENKIRLSYKKGNWNLYKRGYALNKSFLDITSEDVNNVDCIITSPPFVSSIKFYINNWMRLWFVGWEQSTFLSANDVFLDSIQEKNMDIYYSFFEMCAMVLKPNGKVILHLGKSRKYDMAEEISKRANKYFIEVYRGSENVEDLEKHGIKDKGATIEHQYLFLIKRS